MLDEIEPEVTVIEAIVGLQSLAADQNYRVLAPQTADLSGESMQRPSGPQVTDFARAMADSPIREIHAGPVASASSLAKDVAHQIDSLTSHLRNLGPPTNPSTSLTGQGSGGETSGGAEMSDAVIRMERAYMFAIETTMASRGSTEATKILNTLLKGQ